MPHPQPDEHGWYRVREIVGGKPRDYSTRAFSPASHKAINEPASTGGLPLPPVFHDGNHKQPEQPNRPQQADNREAEKEAKKS